MAEDSRKRQLRRIVRKSKKKQGGNPVSQEKAREIMRHGEVHGKKLTKRQKGLFGLIAGGGTPTRVRD